MQRIPRVARAGNLNRGDDNRRIRRPHTRSRLAPRTSPHGSGCSGWHGHSRRRSGRRGMGARSRRSGGGAGGGGAESGEGGAAAAAAAAAAEKDVNVARIVSEDDELVDGIRGLRPIPAQKWAG
jgi:hypothetical protein